jgi:hypothetical protein
MCVDQCNSNERSGLALIRLGLCKLRGKRNETEKERCTLCNKDKNVVHILLKGNETQKLRETFLNNKWLHINEEIAYKNNQL